MATMLIPAETMPLLKREKTRESFVTIFPKRSKEWIAKLIIEKTTRDHLQPMLDAIVEGKSQDSSERSATLTAPHIPRKIASTHRPDEAEVIARDIKIFFMIKHEAVAIERLWRKMCTVNFWHSLPQKKT